MTGAGRGEGTGIVSMQVGVSTVSKAGNRELPLLRKELLRVSSGE